MVLDNIFKFFRELDRRIKVLYTFIGIHLGHQELSTQYTQLYATALGANAVQLGTLNSISRVTGSISAIPSGWLADKYGAKKVLLIGLAFTAIIAALYGFASNWLLLIPAILIYGIGFRLILPFVDMLFINIGKPENKSMIISIARTLWAIPRTFAPIIAAVIITHFGGLNAAGMRPLYYIQIVLATLVFISIALWLKAPTFNSVEKTIQKAKNGSGFIQDFRDLFKGERWLKRWIILFSIRQIGINTSLVFVSLWMVDVKKADPYILGLMAAAGMITAMFLQIPVGRLSDKIGRKKTYFLLRPFWFLATILLIIAPSPEYLILVGILGGNIAVAGEGTGIGGISFIPWITMQLEMVSEEKRGRWHGILGLFGILSFPASILGGIMWEQGLMMEVLLIPVILESLIVIPLMNTIPDTLERSKLQ